MQGGDIFSITEKCFKLLGLSAAQIHPGFRILNAIFPLVIFFDMFSAVVFIQRHSSKVLSTAEAFGPLSIVFLCSIDQISCVLVVISEILQLDARH